MISGQHLIVALWRLRKTWEKHTIPTPESNLYVRGINDAIKVIQEFNAKALHKVFFKDPQIADARLAMLDTFKLIEEKDYTEAKRRLRNQRAYDNEQFQNEKVIHDVSLKIR